MRTDRVQEKRHSILLCTCVQEPYKLPHSKKVQMTEVFAPYKKEKNRQVI
jgi:hypothetical protein